jgi:NAD(P)-dependent dehydrogenase (short-subunit alcohol dehydrogenase family)
MYRAAPKDGIAWVTGASSGIGRASALELARRGWRVVATARRAEQLDELAREAAAAGLRIDAYSGDVTDRSAMSDIATRIEREAGPVALAFLNVGAAFPHDRGDWIGESFRRTMATNFDGALNCLGPLIPAMRTRGRGQIALMASVAGYGGLPGAAAYCASKAALIAMSESLKFSLERAGITMQIVCPGFVRTSMTERGDFPTPFLIECDDAARRICDGFERGGFEIAFPRRMVWPLKAINLLPYPAYFWLFGRAKRG